MNSTGMMGKLAWRFRRSVVTVMDVQFPTTPFSQRSNFLLKQKTNSKSPIGNPVRCRPLGCFTPVVDFAILVH